MPNWFKSSALLLRRIRSYEFATKRRTLSSLSTNDLIDEIESSVLVEGRATSRTAILNRPSNLNAFNISMAYRLDTLYKSWEENRDIGFVVLKGSGRAFCAGGDIVAVYHMMNKGCLEESKEFFWAAYNLIYLLGTYMKPHVAILNGITMGGGTGLSASSLFRLATDKTVFATPETLIGFHPDAGASFHLSHLPGYLGEYLGLTGDRISGVDMMACGLATHYSPIANLPSIEEHLRNLVTNDPSVLETSLEKYGNLAYPDNTSFLGRIETIDKCFSHNTVEEIIDTLGVRARVVDKDFAPKWDPPSLEHVSQDMVDEYFSPLTALEPELELPIKQSTHGSQWWRGTHL